MRTKRYTGRVYNTGDSNRRSRARWDAREIEALKILVAEIPKRERPPETIRVSVFQWGASEYVDLRVYRGGYPTRQGLVIHADLLPDVLAGLEEAAREL